MLKAFLSTSIRGAAFAAFFFVSCVSGEHGTNPPVSSEEWGWRSAGLTASGTDLSDNAGYQRITHVGLQIFAMDAKTVDGLRKYRMFTSRQGSMIWDTLWIPGKLAPYSWLPDSPFVYIGTQETGGIWRFDTRDQSWLDMNTGADSGFSVIGMAKFKGGIIASLASPDKEARPILWNATGKWIDVNSAGQFPLSRSFHTGIEYHGTFYAATYDTSVWAWTPSDAQWKKIQDPSSAFDTTKHDGRFPRSMAVFNDSLYVGFYNRTGVQKLVNGSSWVPVDSCYVYPKDGTTIALCKTPADAYTMTTWNNHLLVAGTWSAIPVVYMAPAQPKGWALLGGDTWKGGMGTTYDMTVVGDTLYTASWDAVWKYPLNQLDSSVTKYSAYPTIPSSSVLVSSASTASK